MLAATKTFRLASRIVRPETLARTVIPSAAPHRATSTTSALGSFYRIEVSNADRPDATKLTVCGPDVDGMMASMTVALAQQGCSLIELHAGKATDTPFRAQVEENQVEDVFYVVSHETGEPFQDEVLKDLGKSLLDALKTPLKVISGNGATKTLTKDLHTPVHSEETQITIIRSSGKAE